MTVGNEWDAGRFCRGMNFVLTYLSLYIIYGIEDNRKKDPEQAWRAMSRAKARNTLKKNK